MKYIFKNENEEEKLFKKRILDRTLHKNTGSDLCLSRYIYQKPCIRFHICFLIIKARLKKYFSASFPKNLLKKYNPFEYTSYDHSFPIKKLNL